MAYLLRANRYSNFLNQRLLKVSKNIIKFLAFYDYQDFILYRKAIIGICTAVRPVRIY